MLSPDEMKAAADLFFSWIVTYIQELKNGQLGQ